MDYFYYNTDDSKHIPPRYPILIEQGFAATGGSYEGYGEQLGQLKSDDILLMYRNGVGLVAVGRVVEEWDKEPHSEPRYYPPEELRRFESGTDEYRIAVEWVLDLSATPIPPAKLRECIGFVASQAVQRIVSTKAEAARLVEELMTEHGVLPGEAEREPTHCEGAFVQRWVNVYERSRQARDECVAKFGSKCFICKFDFGERYGAEFAGFIHVHHLKPLSEVKKEYQVNPVTDLVPVCPNCHAVIHHGGQLRTPDDVRELLEKAGTES